MVVFKVPVMTPRCDHLQITEMAHPIIPYPTLKHPLWCTGDLHGGLHGPDHHLARQAAAGP